MIFQLPVALPLSVCPLQYFRVITVRMGNSSGNSKCDANRTHIRHPHTRNSRSFSGQNANRWGQCQGFCFLVAFAKLPAFFVARSYVDVAPSSRTATFWHFRMANKIDTLSFVVACLGC